MKVLVNGRERELTDGSSLAKVVRAARGDELGRGVAVAVDGEVVPRAQWSEVTLGGGERIEVLAATQGG